MHEIVDKTIKGISRFHEFNYGSSKWHMTVTHLCRAGIRIPSEVTVAKFIIKSSLLLLREKIFNFALTYN